MANPPKSKATIIAPGKRYYGPAALRPSTKYKRGGARRDLYDPSKFVDLTKVKGTPPQAALRQEFQGAQGVPGGGLPQAGLPPPQYQQQPFIAGAGGQDQSFFPPQPPAEAKNWYERTFPQPTETYAETQARNQAEYMALSPAGKITDWTKTVLLAMGESGLTGNIIGRATSYITSKLAARATQLGTQAAKSSLYVTKQTATTYRTTGVIANAGSQIAKNPKSWSLVSKILVGIGVGMTTIGAAGSSIIFGKWQLNEALDNLKYVESEARRDGEFELAEYLRKEKYKVIEFSQSKAMSTPILGALLGNIENTKSALIATRAQDYLADREQYRIDNNLTETDIFRQDAIDREQTKRETIDYYNEQLVIYTELEREARKENRKEEAAFWKQHQIDMMKLAEEERKRVAEFWLEYNKQKAKMMADNSPSQLNFGLLG